MSKLTYFVQGIKIFRKALRCAVSTQAQAPQTEESKMETPKEIFLKDYKMSEYYFDKVFWNIGTRLPNSVGLGFLSI